MAKEKTIFKKMEKFLSTDTSRTALCGFFVEIDEEYDKATVTATDGHVLCSHTLDREQLEHQMQLEYRTLPNFVAYEYIIYHNPKTAPHHDNSLFSKEAIYPKYKNIVPNYLDLVPSNQIDYNIQLDHKYSKRIWHGKSYVPF